MIDLSTPTPLPERLWISRRAIGRFAATITIGAVAVGLAIVIPSPQESRVDLYLTAPGDNPAGTLNSLQTPSLVALALAVDSDVNDQTVPIRLSSESATLFGAGLRSYVSVDVPNYGTQYSTVYSRAIVRVDTVGVSSSDVAAKQKLSISRFRRALSEVQQHANVPLRKRVTAVEIYGPVESPGVLSSGPARNLAMVFLFLAAFSFAQLLYRLIHALVPAAKARQIVSDSGQPKNGL